MPTDVSERYARRLRRMLDLKPREVELSSEAMAASLAWRDELERRTLGDSPDLADMRGWVGKHVGRTARLAGILWAADGAKTDQITGEQYERAIAIGRWLLECSTAALRMRMVEVVETLEDRILQLVTDGVDKLGKLQSRVTAARREHVQPALDRLVENGLLVLEGGTYRVAVGKAA